MGRGRKLSRLVRPWRRPADARGFEAQLDAELRDHIDRLTAAYIAEGMAKEHAKRRALIQFGGLEQMKEACRDTRRFALVDDLSRDLRYAARSIRRNPAFALVVVLTLALGIGATTSVFALVYGVLLRPLPYPNQQRLVRVWEEHPGGHTLAGNRWLSNRTYYAWKEQPRAITALGSFATYQFALAVRDERSPMYGAEVSPELLAVLGARCTLGRLFAPEEANEASPPVAIISESLWHERLGSDPQIIGQPVVVEGISRTIVGVVAADFYFPDRRPRFWIPAVIPRAPTDPNEQNTRAFSAIGLLADGVTPAQAEAEGTAAARSAPVTTATEALFGKGGPPIVHVRLLVSDVSAHVRPALLVLAFAVALVLLIGCANVSNLFMSRGVARERELALRGALGASRGRLIRQLLTEAGLLAALGGACGLASAWMLVRLAPALAPASFPRLDDVQLDSRVLAFAALTSFFTVLASGLIPARRGSRLDVNESLRGRRLRDLVLAAEAALAVLFCVGALLLARSFVQLMQVDGGYETTNVLTARLRLVGDQLGQQSTALIEHALARIRATPGVVSAAASNMTPLAPITSIVALTLPASPGANKPTVARTMMYLVTPGYAETMGLRLKAGRFFVEQDVGAGLRKMIVNDEFARHYLSGPVIGQRFPDLYRDPGSITEIVGVVGRVLKYGNDQPAEPEIYFLHNSPRRIGEQAGAGIHIVIRTDVNPASIAPMLRAVVRDADRSATIETIEPLSQALTASFAQPRFAMAVLVTFATLAMGLAAIGLYGVLSYTVRQRQRELGVRSALGAGRGDLMRLVLHEGLSVTVVGLAIGLIGAFVLTRAMQDLLFGVTALDPVSFAVAPLILACTATVACVVPAARAAAVDPVTTLRAD